MVKAGSSLSKLDIYFSKKNIQKQKNNNIVFISKFYLIQLRLRTGLFLIRRSTTAFWIS